MGAAILALAVYCAIVGSVALIIARHPAACLILAINLFALKQWAQTSIPIIAQRQSLTNVLVGSLVLGGVLLQLVRGRVRKPAYPPQVWLITALLLYALASIAWAPEPEVSIGRWKDGFPYLVTMIYLAPLAVQDREDLHVAFSGTLVVGIVVAALLLFSVEWEGRQVVLSRVVGGEAVGGNPLTVGQLGGTLVLLGVLYQPISGAVPYRLLKPIAVIIGLALVARSGSRGQFVGAVIVAAAFWAFANPSRRTLKPLIGLVVAAALAVLAKIGAELYWAGDSRFSVAAFQGDYLARLQNAAVLLRHWAQSPLSIVFGLGNSASYDVRILGIYPHIVPLEVLGEEGIVGFVMFIVLVIWTIVAGARTIRALGDDSDARSLFACVAGLWIYSFLLINKQGSLLLAQDFFLYTILVSKRLMFAESALHPTYARTVDRRPTNLLN